MSRNYFSGIAGYESEKRELQKIAGLFRNMDMLDQMNVHLPRGVLLLGAPGVGKTVLAEALIKDSQANCVRVECTKVGDETELSEYLQDKFIEASKNCPSIVFIDEMDKIVGESSFGMFGSFDMSATRILLKAINEYVTDEVMVLATANDEEMIAPALRRSGRFDRVVNIPLPNADDRKKILQKYFVGKRLGKNVNIDLLSRVTCGMSGADIESIVNEAGLTALTSDRTCLMPEDFDEAIGKMSFGALRRENNVGEKRAVALHEVGHVVAALLLDEDGVGSVSVLGQGGSDGHMMLGQSDRSAATMKNVLNQITILLAGKASADMYCDDVQLGAGSDIAKAFGLAENLVAVDCCYGYKYYKRRKRQEELSFSITENQKEIEEKCRSIICECEDRAKKLLGDNKQLVFSLVDELVLCNVMSREEILRVYTDYKQTASAA